MTSTILETTQCHFLREPVTAPAFSFFFRIHSGSEKQLHDAGHMRNRCHEVFKNAGLETSIVEVLKTKCDALIDAMELRTGAKSIGLFVAPGAAHSHLYYVNLPELHYAGKSFSCYESMYAVKASAPYLLFLFEPSSIEIYKGKGSYLETLPKSKEVTHLLSVYAHRAPKRADKDGKLGGSELFDHKWKEEFYSAWADVMRAEAIPAYAAGLELIGATTEESTAKGIQLLFANLASLGKTSPENLKQTVKELRNSYRAKVAAEYVSSIETAGGAHKMVCSMDEIVDCARAGQAELLLVEDPEWKTDRVADFTQMHEAITQTLVHNGKVEFLPEGSLRAWKGHVLLLRYC